MFVTVHLLSGTVIASSVPNPLLAIPLAFGSHFLLDYLPHWPKVEPFEKLARKIYVAIALDLMVLSQEEFVLLLENGSTSMEKFKMRRIRYGGLLHSWL